jgi:hypothetical protein
VRRIASGTVDANHKRTRWQTEAWYAVAVFAIGLFGALATIYWTIGGL